MFTPVFHREITGDNLVYEILCAFIDQQGFSICVGVDPSRKRLATDNVLLPIEMSASDRKPMTASEICFQLDVRLTTRKRNRTMSGRGFEDNPAKYWAAGIATPDFSDEVSIEFLRTTDEVARFE